MGSLSQRFGRKMLTYERVHNQRGPEAAECRKFDFRGGFPYTPASAKASAGE